MFWVLGSLGIASEEKDEKEGREGRLTSTSSLFPPHLSFPPKHDSALNLASD